MAHFQAVQSWVAGFDPALKVLPTEKRVLQKIRDITGRCTCRVSESFVLQRIMPRCYESLEKFQALEAALTLGNAAPVLGENCVFFGEKAQLAQVLPGENGLYQVTLRAEYILDLEDEYGED